MYTEPLVSVRLIFFLVNKFTTADLEHDMADWI